MIKDSFSTLVSIKHTILEPFGGMKDCQLVLLPHHIVCAICREPCCSEIAINC